MVEGKGLVEGGADGGGKIKEGGMRVWVEAFYGGFHARFRSVLSYAAIIIVVKYNSYLKYKLFICINLHLI